MHLKLSQPQARQLAIALPTQGICYNICLYKMVMKSKIIIFQCLHPSPLPRAQILLSEDVFQTLMIRVHLKLLSIQIVSLSFKGKHYCCKLQIMCWIVPLM